MRTKFQTSLLLIITSVLLCACSNTFHNLKLPRSDIETRMLSNAKTLELAIINSGQLRQEQGFINYTTSVAHKLYGDNAKQLRFHVINLPTVKAYALPNGSIFLHAGLIARLQNEAQLAFVIAHEATHVFEKHSLHARHHREGADRNDSATLPPSEAKAFSQQQELAADKEALTALKKTGYDTSEIISVLKTLLAESKHTKHNREPTHPAISSRIAALETGTSKGGLLAQDSFIANTSGIRSAAFRLDLEFGRYANLLAALTQFDNTLPLRSFYLAEAMRRNNNSSDDEAAVDYYKAQIKSTPNHAGSHLGLALLAMELDRLVLSEHHYDNFKRLKDE